MNDDFDSRAISIPERNEYNKNYNDKDLYNIVNVMNMRSSTAHLDCREEKAEAKVRVVKDALLKWSELQS